MSGFIKSRRGVAETPMYKPGLPIDLVAREYGIEADSIVKLASNENPLGPSPRAVDAIAKELNGLNRYPDGGAWELTSALSRKLGIDSESLIIGNGSNEILELLAQAFLEPGTNAVMGEFPFVVYPLVAKHFGADIKRVAMPDLKHDLEAMLDAIDAQTRIVFIASPNNPTPAHVSVSDLEVFIRKLPEHVILCFDRAYAEYLDEKVDLTSHIKSGKNILVTHTFSKIYGLAGLRIGYAYGPEWIISLLARTRQPFSVNSLALAGALAALDDHEFLNASREVNRMGVAQLVKGLEDLGLSHESGQANFILVKVPDPSEVCEKLLEKGVIVRSMAPFSLDGMVRVSVGLQSENERFLATLADVL